jgi:hypothetical protein
MRYLSFVMGDHLPEPPELAVMQREIPGFVREMTGRGVYVLGRPLDIPETGTTVRASGGETLVSDGPFVESKEFVAGFTLLDCADLDEVIEVEAKGSVSWFMTNEIRRFTDGPWLSEKAAAFGRGDDGDASPWALLVWAGGSAPPPPAGPAGWQAAEAWRQDLAARGLLILGGTLEDAAAATTLRVRDGQKQLADGPFFPAGESVAGLDVVSCAGREQAIELAAAHPLAPYHPIEVRPFE